MLTLPKKTAHGSPQIDAVTYAGALATSSRMVFAAHQ